MEQIAFGFEEDNKAEENKQGKNKEKEKKEAEAEKRPYPSEEEKLAKIRARHKGEPSLEIKEGFYRH